MSRDIYKLVISEIATDVARLKFVSFRRTLISFVTLPTQLVTVVQICAGARLIKFACDVCSFTDSHICNLLQLPSGSFAHIMLTKLPTDQAYCTFIGYTPASDV